MIIPSLLLGLGLGALFLGLAKYGPAEERQVWAVGLVVAAVIYVGFAIAAQAPAPWLLIECLGLLVYSSLAILGLRHRVGWLALGWLLHPLWDLVLHFWQAGSEFTPGWYVLSCLSFDLLVGAVITRRSYLGNLMKS